CQQYKSLPLTF
nr:immunoglobulin light chain junction region [Macaca mulatta]MOV36955.1 immunoglobulin light chain junction region [Macaca mulatta]MOV36956.1 immunoglobulin light chain junction region [Macaca mulatta]MOV36976.1 immunoglobulin light chain junction region [Macaca mulatta]MOV37039.1 immunoglobulin light chain junction region [Macaca mulatta]